MTQRSQGDDKEITLDEDVDLDELVSTMEDQMASAASASSTPADGIEMVNLDDDLEMVSVDNDLEMVELPDDGQATPAPAAAEAATELIAEPVPEPAGLPPDVETFAEPVAVPEPPAEVPDWLGDDQPRVVAVAGAKDGLAFELPTMDDMEIDPRHEFQRDTPPAGLAEAAARAAGPSKCMYCGTEQPVPPEALCVNCGRRIPTLKFYEPAEPEPNTPGDMDEEERVLCPICSTLNLKHRTTCISCGSRLVFRTGDEAA